MGFMDSVTSRVANLVSGPSGPSGVPETITSLLELRARRLAKLGPAPDNLPDFMRWAAEKYETASSYEIIEPDISREAVEHARANVLLCRRTLDEARAVVATVKREIPSSASAEEIRASLREAREEHDAVEVAEARLAAAVRELRNEVERARADELAALEEWRVKLSPEGGAAMGVLSTLRDALASRLQQEQFRLSAKAAVPQDRAEDAKNYYKAVLDEAGA